MRVNNLHSYYNQSSPGMALISPGRLLADRKKMAKKKKAKPPQVYSTTNLCHLGLLVESGVLLENVQVTEHSEQSLEEALISLKDNLKEPDFATPTKLNA
jgi:hypothetical protein